MTMLRGGLNRLLTGVAVAACCWLTSGEASATEYGCYNLSRVSGQPVVEGTQGFFFRARPDLSEHFPLGDHTITLVKALAAALESRGTTLVYAPIPTKGIVSGPFLPPRGADGIFDQSLARHSYDSFVARLRRAGVHTIDIASAINVLPGQPPSFLGADHHWTSLGARGAAQAAAELIKSLPVYQGLEKQAFTSKSIGQRIVLSTMRRTIQASCREPLPPNSTEGFETELALGTGEGASLDLFGGSSASGRIVVVGTSFTDSEEFNFAGFISEFTGIDVSNVAVAGGNQFVSILSYFTSPAFAEAPPQVLVWENPIYNNLGEFGETPLLELIAAASGVCEPDQAAAVESGTIVVPLQKLQAKSGEIGFVAFDAGNPAVIALTVDFLSADGSHALHRLIRSDRFQPNGRFFVPLPEGAGGLVSASVKSDGGADMSRAKVKLCRYAFMEG